VKLARVVGTVTSTINVPVYDGRKLLLCDLVGPDGSPADGYLIAVDTVGAGAGEMVLLIDEATRPARSWRHDAPVRALIVGIVDVVEVSPGEGQESRAEAAPARPTRSRARAKPGPKPAPKAVSKAEASTRRARSRRSA
jgi:ethanolamine utilization protein EutN